MYQVTAKRRDAPCPGLAARRMAWPGSLASRLGVPTEMLRSFQDCHAARVTLDALHMRGRRQREVLVLAKLLFLLNHALKVAYRPQRVC